jgi:diguanylate cyclase (GGDEF)-like protein
MTRPPEETPRLELKVLEFAQKLMETANFEDLLDFVDHEARSLLSAKRVSLSILEPGSAERLRLSTGDDGHTEASASDGSFIGEAIKAGRTLSMRVDEHANGEPHDAASLGVTDIVVAPMMLGDRCIGALNVGFDDAPPAIVDLITHIARLIAGHVDRLRRRDDDTAASGADDQGSVDRLTGLPDHAAFEHTIADELARVRADATTSGLLCLAAAGLGEVREEHGELTVDSVLRELASRLQRTVFEGDVVARSDSGEFLLLLHESDAWRREMLAKTLLDTVAGAPIETDEVTVHLTASVGLCHLDDRAGDHADAIQRARNACTRAIEAGGDQLCIASDADAAVDPDQRSAAAEIADVRTALSEDRFTLHGQPIQHVGSGRVHAVEMLLRFPDGQLLRPAGAILTMAERLGLTDELDEWVVKQALELCPRIADQHGSDTRVFINLSATSLCRQGVGERVLSLIADSPTPPNRVCFEITETGTMQHFAATLDFVSLLRGVGVQFALDDFGVGLSSLAHLRRIPVNYLKIDASLVRGIDKDPVLATMVQSITAMADALGMAPIAEHVETEGVLNKLRQLGVQYAQGFLLGRPEAIDGADEITPGDQRILSRV